MSPAARRPATRSKHLRVDARPLVLDDLEPVFAGRPVRLSLTAQGRRRVSRSRAVIEDVLRTGRAVYGVNTGFGKLARERVSPADLERLQVNLLRSHACGVGRPLPPETVRAILLLRIRNLCQGHSGVRPVLLDRMIALFNADLTPVVPEQGSVGASGDLAPLAHLALALIGEGEVFHGGRVVKAATALRKAGIAPLTLGAKEGLALINGTQVTTGIGARALLRARRLARTADLVCAMTVDAYKGTSTADDPRIHAVRGQKGQILVADNLRRLLQGSPIRRSHQDCARVQDPYSLRCAPQVHGAVRDTLDEAQRVFEIEMNAVTDNPLVFPEEGEVLSGGNFHAAPVAAAADHIAIAITDLASISERRVENLVNPDLSSLPAFLSRQPGLQSGFMIPQVVAAAQVSECKAHAHPASVDTIPTSANFEDHVSMGPIAARKALHVVECAETVVAIELLCACQALDFEAAHRSSKALDAVYRFVRETIPHVDADRSMHPDIRQATAWIQSGRLLEVAAAAGRRIR